MPLPLLPTLSPDSAPDSRQDIQGLWLYLSRLKDALDGFTPSQVAAALDIGSLGYSGNSPFAGITLPAAAATPSTPTGLTATGFYRQIGLNWDLDVNPNITGWTVQRADDAGFTSNVTVLTQARSLAFIDNIGTDNTTKYYRIKADGKNASSSYTAVVSATTLGADTTALTALQNAVVFLQRAHIQLAVIDSARITDAAIVTAKIADASITTAKIALLAVTSAVIADAAITNAKIANLAVTNAKINDLSADKLTAGTITALVKVAANQIELDGVNNVITIKDTQGSPVVRVKIGKLSAGATDYGIIIYNASGGVMWSSLDSGVQSIGIKDLAIISDKLNDLAVLTGKIANNAVTANSSFTSSSLGFSTTSTSYVDTGITASITTTGSPVVIWFSGNLINESTSGANQLDRVVTYLRLTRDGTAIYEWIVANNIQGNAAAPNDISGQNLMHQDGASAAAHTYKIQARVDNAVSKCYFSTAANLLVMEVKK